MSRSFVLVLPFHLGRLDTVEACEERDILREAGVGVTAEPVLDGVGDPSPCGLGIDDFRPVRGAATCVKPEYRRTLDMVDRVVELPTELSRRLEPPNGVLYPLPRITEDAGELPGVSMALPVAGLSIVMILEMESRKC